MASVLTIILNWRSHLMTLRAVEAALIALDGVEGALIVVDNDSKDGSFEALSRTVVARGWDIGPQRVRVLQSGHNGGFGAGNNVGIRTGLPDGSRPDYYYILNSDAFPEAGAIKALRDHLERHPKTGFAGSFIYGEDLQPHRTAFRFPSVASEFEAQIRFGPVSKALRNSIVAQPVPEVTQQVDWLAGASLMMRAKVIETIGIFDESFFLYFEETDLCRRAALAGWPTDYVLESRVMHLGSVSTGMKEWRRIPSFWLDSRLHYFVKNHGRAYAFAATWAHLAGGILWRGRLLIQRKEPGDPPRYLRDLTAHHMGAAWRAVAPRRKFNRKTTPSA